MRKYYYLVAALFFPFSQAQAACGLSLSASNVNITWSLNFTSIAVQMTINKSLVDACDFGIGISKGGGASYATRTGTDSAKVIRYQIYNSNTLTNIVKDVPDITSANDVIQGGFASGTNLTQNVLYYLEVPYNLATTPTMVSAGTYTDSYTINIYEGSDPLAFTTPVDTAAVSLTITVDKLIELSLVDSGGSFQVASTNRSIDFGTLSQGQASAFDLRVRTNAGFNVTFSSANDGRLKHTTQNSYVPYNLYVNAVLLNMSSSNATPVVGLSGSGQTALSGLAYPLRLVIGSLTGASLSGSHSDQITITATTTE